MRKLNFCFKTMLLLCAFIVGGGINSWAGTYTQLTSIADIDESAQYVLGIDGTGFHYEGTSSWGKCALPSAQTPLYYTLTKSADGTSFTAKTTIDETTYYLQIPTSNTFGMATSTGTNTDIIIGTTKVSETNYAVANKGTTDRHLRINGESGLRSYASTTGTMAYFYKVTLSQTPEIVFATPSAIVIVGNSYTQTATAQNTGDATITYTSLNPEIATVNASTGEVTGVAAGTATIKASVTINDTEYTATYTVQVVKINDGEFDFTLGIDYGSRLTPSNTQQKSDAPYTFTAGNVTITTAGSGNFLWNTDFRIYANSSIVIAAPENHVITKIVFTGSSMTNGTIEDTPFENATENTWTGKANSVTVARGAGGTVTIKTIAVTYEEKGSKETATAAISAKELALTAGLTTSASITTEPAGLVVAYTTSNSSIATVSNEGVVTPAAVGTATITASWEEQDVNGTTYEAGSKQFEINVHEIEDGIFDFTTECLNYDSDVEPGSSATTSESKWTAGNVTMDVAGRNVWYNGASLRLYKTSGEDAAGNITISVPTGYVITKIILTGGSNLEITNGGGTKSGTTWTGMSQSVKFTHNEGSTITLTKIAVYYTEPTISISMGEAGYMTYCNQNANLSFGDIKAYIVSSTDDNIATLTPITEAPANTPVILEGTAGTHEFTVIESAAAISGNKLYKSNGTSAISNESRTVYVLANDAAKGVGFYKWAGDASLSAGKIYLSVSNDDPTGGAPEFIGLTFGNEATGVKAIENSQMANGNVYNLNGQRVSQPKKGLYIVNGKKVIVK
ncbi:MAG: Ig-like domain-containing protein [Prevotella sp.]|nr:Ig-like domain-containing protein [Prevotella sp.]